ncbi:MAG: AIR synthase family protein [Candidatus Bathyarchaeota archaeon]|nr:AIR synthase family protein [Candidatus Bathyarchaeota archaeon]MDH5747341.1 AIR synthase family protein [Candidatus Bathyarchaeota archaeon]
MKRGEVVLGPAPGFDGAVIDVGDKSLIVSMDPITGAIERIGWLAVNVNANDVATFGVEPVFFFSCILLPENANKKIVETICVQMDKAAKDLGMAIVGGHCEVTPGLTNPVVVGCTVGITEKGNYVTAGGAKPGNKLIITKTIGIEGTAILANDREAQLRGKLDDTLLGSAKNFFNVISVVEEATLAFQTGGVTAMHDPTEGGIAGGIHELADASNVGVKIFEEKISMAKETFEICRIFRINPLQLISSGTLLIAAKEDQTEKIVDVLKENGIDASVVGVILKNSQERVLIHRNGSRTRFMRPLCDHLWLALKKRV